MILLLSGEGPTDLGHTVPGSSGPEDRFGPLVYLIDGLVEEKYGYRPSEHQCCRIFSKHDLGEYAKQLKDNNQKRMKLPGLKRQSGIGFYFANARALGFKAKELAEQENTNVIPVLFRDTDSREISDYNQKRESIQEGFQAAGTDSRGVPMLAKPKSEAWLLCMADNYENGLSYANGPANDNAPNPLKKQLAEKVLPGKARDQLSREELCQFIEGLGTIDFVKLAENCPSCGDFIRDFEAVLKIIKF